jgi:hypothetical protein
MANSRKTVAQVLNLLASRDIKCDVFGGWAEEFLGIRNPGPHTDIDLVYRAECFTAIDAAISALTLREVVQKRFRHKRAFIFNTTLCEIILVKSSEHGLITDFWGDVPFRWDLPFLHQSPYSLEDLAISIVHADNLRKYKRERNDIQPFRWQDPSSLELK